MSDRDETNVFRLLFRLETSAVMFKYMDPESKDEFFEFLQEKLNLQNERINSYMTGGSIYSLAKKSVGNYSKHS